MECENCPGCVKKSIINNDSMIETFVREGFDPDTINAEGKTPLMIAAYSGNIEAAEDLIKYSCNPFIVDYNGMTALDIAKYYGNNEIAILLEKRMKTKKRPRPLFSLSLAQKKINENKMNDISITRTENVVHNSKKMRI